MQHPGVFITALCVLLLISQAALGSEIIGGKEAEPHSLPFMALLRGKTWICGGTLISPSWILTAAHCGEIKEVQLGVHAITENKGNTWQVQKVQKRFPHPCFDEDEKVNDLMLLSVKKVRRTRAVQWLQLGTSVPDPAEGSSCLVAGWGRTNNVAKHHSSVLREVNVTVIGRARCNSERFYNSTPVITKSMICAGSSGKNSADTCRGDSGGPLICDTQLVGVTSFGKKCGMIHKPGVYSFLTKKQLVWIQKTMKRSEEEREEI